MVNCEICGRYPAKQMTFKAHQDFVLYRRETEISGVFCRDHAFAAYAAAQGKTLKGMWFSPTTILFGTLRSLWDSAKLLDLPTEVVDEPWMLHIAGCPSCNHEHFATSGPVVCEKCGHRFVIVSCEKCAAFDVIDTKASFDSVKIVSCRKCTHETKAPHATRNSPVILVAKALAEIAAKVARSDGVVDEKERRALGRAVEAIFSFQLTTHEYVKCHFDNCLKDHSLRFYKSCVENCQPEVLRLIIMVAASVAEADGVVDETERALLWKLARSLGFDPESMFAGSDARHTSRQDSGREWWYELNVVESATYEQVKIAYHKLARQFHPDLWRHAPESGQESAAERMKAINAAYAIARKHFEVFQAKRGASDVSDAAREDQKRREAEERTAEKLKAAARREEKKRASEERQAAARREEEKRAADASQAAAKREQERLAAARREEEKRTDEARRAASLREQEAAKGPDVRDPRQVAASVENSSLTSMWKTDLIREGTEPTRDKTECDTAIESNFASTRQNIYRYSAALILVIFAFALSTYFLTSSPSTSTLSLKTPTTPSLPTPKPSPPSPIPAAPNSFPTQPAEFSIPAFNIQVSNRVPEAPLPVAKAPEESNLTSPKKAANSEVDDAIRRGVRLCKEKKYEEAVKEFTVAITLDPLNDAALWDRGNAYNNLGKFELACEDLSKSIRQNGESSSAYGNRAWANLGLGRLEQALEDADKAISLDGNNGWAFYYRAMAQEFLHQDPRRSNDSYSQARSILTVVEYSQLHHAKRILDQRRLGQSRVTPER